MMSLLVLKLMIAEHSYLHELKVVIVKERERGREREREVKHNTSDTNPSSKFYHHLP